MNGTVCYLLFDFKRRHTLFLPEVFKLSAVDHSELLFIDNQPLPLNLGFSSFITPKQFGTAVSLIISCMFPFWQHMNQIHSLLNFAQSAPTKYVLSLHLTIQHRQAFVTSAP